MFLLRLSKVDVKLLFNQGFRIVLSIITMLCYTLLFCSHLFMMRAFYNICGKDYFSLLSRSLFSKKVANPVAATYREVTMVCRMTTILDLAVLTYGLMFASMVALECCMAQRKRCQLARFKQEQADARRGGGGAVSSDEGNLDVQVMRQRLNRKVSANRFIMLLGLLAPVVVLSTLHLGCAIAIYLMFHLALPTIDPTIREANKSYLNAIDWHSLPYMGLSFFMCGFSFSMFCINKNMLSSIILRNKRQQQFKRMNASVVTEGDSVF